MPHNRSHRNAPPGDQPKVTLRTIADHLGLTPGTVSAALNDSAAARTIPEHTRQRILEAARDLKYRPNYFARSLRLNRTHTIGVIVDQIGDPYGAGIISGIEKYLRETEYFFLTATHRHDQRILHDYSEMLISRGVEGFITVDISITEKPALPTIAVAGHVTVPGVTNLILNHELAARLAMRHLLDLGHRDIAFIKGHPRSSDSATRWGAICAVCAQLEIQIARELVVEITNEEPTLHMGYPYARELLSRGRPFTAIFAYNDLAAAGAVWALHEAGLRVPEDASVVGFDDAPLAVFGNPALTTIRQPLERMGELAAKTLIDRIEQREEYQSEIVVAPELIVRSSTAQAPLRRAGVKPIDGRPRLEVLEAPGEVTLQCRCG
jgi:LacI family transcriptional regulator